MGILRVWEDAFYVMTTRVVKGKGFGKEGFESMGEKGMLNLEEGALGAFRQSYNRRYEQWKKKDLFTIAVQTMPKQVRNGEVPSDGAKNLESDVVYNKQVEELRTLYKQERIDKDTYLRLWQILAQSRMKQAGYVYTRTSSDGATMYFKER